MSGLKFTLSDVTSFLPDNFPGLEIIISGMRHHMSLSGKFIKVAIETWSACDWNP